MHFQAMPVGDLHAELWAGLTIHKRIIDGPDDITVGEHPDLGRCYITHWSFDDEIKWCSDRPISEAIMTKTARKL